MWHVPREAAPVVLLTLELEEADCSLEKQLLVLLTLVLEEADCSAELELGPGKLCPHRDNLLLENSRILRLHGLHDARGTHVHGEVELCNV